MIELKERLAAIANYIPQNSVVIDVGTDHAYLPIYLVQQGICPKAMGTDIHEGPYKSAVDKVKEQGLEDKIEIYLGDGLKPIISGQGDVAVIAGMGGTTIVSILTAGSEVLTSVKRLILQPMVASASLRHWLLDNGWAIVDEKLVEEEKRIYEIIVAERGVQEPWPEVLMELGPKIVAKGEPLLPELIDRKVMALRAVLEQMGKTDNPEVKEKMAEINKKINDLQGVLQ